MLGHNKTCELEDFSDPELLGIIRDVFKHEIGQYPPQYPNGVPDSKQWEIAMSVRSLGEFGALHREATALGVGAGTEATVYYLTKHVKRVFATDLYLWPGPWSDVAPSLMLAEPDLFAPYDFEQDRLVVQHMDGRILRYADNSFDGIFSSGSIEHFGSPTFIANAAYEMGRVLKPGGVLTLATEYRISGPPGGKGWDTSTFIFCRDDLLRYIVQASGLELVDELNTEVSEQTMLSKRDLVSFLSETRGKNDWRTRIANYPNLVLVHMGYVFSSVFLTLRKTDRYPSSENAWARPSQATRDAVNAVTQQELAGQTLASPSMGGVSLVARLAEAPSGEGQPSARVSRAPSAATQGIEAELNEIVVRWHDVNTHRMQTPRIQRLPRPIQFVYRTMFRLRRLGIAWAIQTELYRAFLRYFSALDGSLEGYGSRLNEYHGAFTAFQQTQAEETEELHERLSSVEVLLGEYHDHSLAVQESRSKEIEKLYAQSSSVEERVNTRLREFEDLIARVDGVLSDLDRRVKENTSYVRMFRQTEEVKARSSAADQFFLTGDEVLDVIRLLEGEVPELHSAEAVDISIQDVFVENILVRATAHFGDRLSAKREVNRMSNDAWYHFDPTSNWNRATLFSNAVAKLVPGGIFVLITSPEFVEKIAPEDLSVKIDRTVETGTRRARVLVFKTEKAT